MINFKFSYSKILYLGAAALFSVSFLSSSPNASAQEVQFGKAYQDDNSTATAQAPAGATGGGTHGGEHFHAKGHRPPPTGYQEAPSADFENGPDPDHQAKIHRDATTGADLSQFGTAYQNSSPTQSGSLGDSTGNGWTAPRGNGW